MSNKLTIDDMNIIAKKRSGQCLSTKYTNSRTKLIWRCDEGHIWEATPSNINSGKWCPDCSKNKKKTIDHMRKLALDKGGNCLSEVYSNAHSKLLWECTYGHTWEASYNQISKGSWCPKCAGKVQITIDMMKSIAEQNGGKCISEKYIDIKTKLQWQCSEGHLWWTTPALIKRGSWCPICSGNSRQTIGEMKKISKQRGGECLSEEYINSHTKLKWECGKGHIWYATPNNIKQGHWCPECAGNKRITLKNVKDLAISKGGECLSDEYINAHSMLLWVCSEGHRWYASYSSTKAGRWCSDCSGRKK